MALGSLGKDIRYGLRMLRRSPGFTTVAVLSLALGIGANTAIFSLIDRVLLKMLPVREPDRLVVFNWQGTGFTYNQYKRLRDDTPLFNGVLGYSPARLSLSVDGELESASEGQLVTGNYFPTLGVNALLGRVLTPDDDRVPGGHPVAVISQGFWKRRFAMDPGILNRKIHIAGIPYTIVGVTPADFFGMEVGSSPDVFVPVMMQQQAMPGMPSWLNDRQIIMSWLHVVGRLKPGVTISRAADSLQTIAAQFNAEVATFVRRKFPTMRAPKAQSLELTPGGKGLSALRLQFSQPLLILMSVVGLVLLIACANVASLLLARAATRQKEITVRLALGARRIRLVQQLLTESVMLSMLGGIGGLLFSRWAAGALLAFLPRSEVPIRLDLSPDLRVLGFTFAISLLTGILFGLAPAIRATNLSLAPALAGTGTKPGQMRIGKALVIGQISVSILLLVGAGLFVRTFQNLRNVDTGFDREHILSVRVEPAGSDQRTPQLDQTYQGLMRRLAAMPGVRAASMGGYGPISRSAWERGQSLDSANQAAIDGYTIGQETVRLPWMQIYPNYFAAMGIPLMAGRDFSFSDSEGQKEVVIVNESLARTYFANRNPVGGRIGFGGQTMIRWMEIVGVVKDAHYASLREPPMPMFYAPFMQRHTGRGQMTLHVRTSGDPIAVARAVRREIQEVSGGAPLFEMQTLAAQVDSSLVQERLIAALCGLFGVVALLLVSIGLFGLMAYSVTRRTREIGVRMALGARASDVSWLVLRETLLLAAIGLAIGLPASVALTRLISSRLFGLSPSDPVTLGGAALLMASVALLAGYIPARRASGVDPMSALRYE
jgi:predicted permease